MTIGRTFELAFALDIIKELGHDVRDVKFDATPGPISDSLPFQRKGVPALWLRGENKPIFFHTARDDPQTLDYNKLKRLLDANAEIIRRVATQKELPF